MKSYHLSISSLIALSLMGCQNSSARQKEKPNILFIISDDHSFQMLGSVMKEAISTPNLDRLRNDGVYFSHAYNSGAWMGAVSMASRSMLVTGQHLWKVRDYSKSTRTLIDEKPAPEAGGKPIKNFRLHDDAYWPQHMKKAGYETYFAGKWHNVGIVEQLFDHFRNVRGGMADQHSDCYQREFIENKPDKWQPYDKSYGGFWQGGEHWSEVLKKDALLYLDQIKQHDDPFFLYLGFNAPHDPRQSPKSFVDMYPPSQIAVPENFAPKYEYADSIGCSMKLRDEQLAPSPRTEYSIQVNRQEYFASISHMDQQIGEILDKLEAIGELDNTYIIYTSDHGIAIGDHGLLGKQNMYDASMRVPFFISGPDIPKGVTINEMIYLQDAMATCLDLAGSDALNKVDFKSVLPLIRGDAGRDYIYGAYMDLQRMVCNDHYKMIIYPKVGVIRLFDLKEDPNEMYDLALQERFYPVMNDLYNQFKQLQKEHGDLENYDELFNVFINRSTILTSLNH